MLFNKRKLPKILRDSLTSLERKILNTVAENLRPGDSERLMRQIDSIKFIRRMKYRRDTVIELYPESVDSIPPEMLFGRNQEFIIATVRYELNGKLFSCKLRAVLGALFEITITPSPSNISADKIDAYFSLKHIQLEENLGHNTL
jgi:hypothetical protein